MRRYGAEPGAEVRERLEFELGVIGEMGFDAYFLIVWDYVKFAKDNGIAVGPGRGSAAGSIVSYALGITDIDPLKYDLLFERFLNPGRKSMPDIDMDFSVDAPRARSSTTWRDKYGRDRVAQIITFGTMAARAAMRDAARVMGMPYAVGDKIAKMIPEQAPPATFDAGHAARRRAQAGLRRRRTRSRRSSTWPCRLEGLIRNDSIHAAAVVISDQPLTEYLPLQQKGDAELVTQFDMNDVAKLGLLKMDFLGLRNLDVIEAALEIIEKTDGVCIEIDQLPLDDEKTYQMLARGDSTGVFQFESPGMREALRDVAPHAVRGPHRHRGALPPGPDAVHPHLRAQQEGPGLGRLRPRGPAPHPGAHARRDHLPGAVHGHRPPRGRLHAGAGRRPAQGHQQEEQRADGHPQGARSCRASRASGVPPAVANKLWASFEATGDYSFNKSHAACYALISYRTAWLKANYPVEYMAALISQRHEHQGQGAVLREPVPRDGHRGAAAGRQRERRRLHRGGRQDPLRPERRQGRGRGAIEAIIAARAARPLHLASTTSAPASTRRWPTSACSRRSSAAAPSTAPATRGAACSRRCRRPWPTASGAARTPPRARAASSTSWRRTTSRPTGRRCRSASSTRPRCSRARRRPSASTSRPTRCRACASSCATRSRSPRARSTTPPTAAMLWTGGIVANAQKKVSKNGGVWLAFRLEDVDGGVECRAWPATYEQYRDLLVEDAIVKVKGRVERKPEGETRLIAIEVAALQRRQRVPPAHRDHRRRARAAQVLDDLKRILADFPGQRAGGAAHGARRAAGPAARRRRPARGAGGRPVRRAQGAARRELRRGRLRPAGTARRRSR